MIRARERLFSGCIFFSFLFGSVAFGSEFSFILGFWLFLKRISRVFLSSRVHMAYNRSKNGKQKCKQGNERAQNEKSLSGKSNHKNRNESMSKS